MKHEEVTGYDCIIFDMSVYVGYLYVWHIQFGTRMNSWLGSIPLKQSHAYSNDITLL